MADSIDKTYIYGSFVALFLILSAVIVAGVPLVGAEEEYTTEEPYQTTETYTEQVTKERTVGVDYQTSQFEINNAFYGIGSDSLSIDVRNTDEEGGTFEVTFNTCTPSADVTLSDQQYLAAGESSEFSASTEADLQQDCTTARVDPPTKQETYYDDVQRERTVTKTREVQKTRTKKVTILEALSDLN